MDSVPFLLPSLSRNTMTGTFFKKGQWNGICDRCGEKRKSGDLKKTWDGFYVCPESCWEERHPQDFLRGKKDDSSVAWTRPEPTDTETDTSAWATPTSVPSGTFDNSL